jgi:hypothetical protein
MTTTALARYSNRGQIVVDMGGHELQLYSGPVSLQDWPFATAKINRRSEGHRFATRGTRKLTLHHMESRPVIFQNGIMV